MLKGIIDIDRCSSVSLSEQIYRQIRLAVRDKKLETGQRLLSSRMFSQQLGVSRNVVSIAYDLLKAEAIIDVHTGSAPRIAKHIEVIGRNLKTDNAPSKHPSISKRGEALSVNARAGLRSDKIGVLTPGEPALDVFPSDIWARCLRRVSRSPKAETYLYQNISGLPDLTTVLAEHLSDVRGVTAEPNQILITTSTQASLMLASLCLADSGDTAYLESPGYLGAHGSFISAGLNLLPLGVDSKGAIPPSLNSAVKAKLIYLTPSNQFPLGYTLSLQRRLQFIDYARRQNAIILEDDYDSEFLFSDRPVAALQGLAPNSTIYMGTFAKTMLPGLRLGYMVVPEKLISVFQQAIRNIGVMASAPIQLAMADFITSGHYSSHLRHIKQVYKTRGNQLASRLREELGNDIQVLHSNGGVQLVIYFNRKLDDVALALAIQAQGVNASSLSATYLEASKTGLIIGYGQASLKNIDYGVSVIKSALKLAKFP